MSQKLHRVDRQPTVADFGISVIRPVEVSDLEIYTDKLLSACGPLILRRRGDYGDKITSAITLVEMKEAKFQPGLASVTTQEASDAIYTDVPSLRRPLRVTPERPRTLGWSESHTRQLGFELDAESRQFLDEEREQIWRALGDLATCGFELVKRSLHTPHISLARVSNANSHEAVRRAWHAFDGMEDQPPIRIQRARILDPSRMQRNG